MDRPLHSTVEVHSDAEGGVQGVVGVQGPGRVRGPAATERYFLNMEDVWTVEGPEQLTVTHGPRWLLAAL